jgi:hypothetical protein
MTDGVAVTAKVTLEGPFFTKNPGNTLYENLRDMLDKVAAELEGIVRRDMESNEAAMPFWTGWSRDHAIGYTTSGKTGKRWATWAAVGSVTAGMSAKDARRTKAAAATIEHRFHPYRHAKDAAYRTRALISADLAKGLE